MLTVLERGTMRTLAAAVVVGLALGAAALGPFTPIEGPQRTNADGPVIDDDMPVASFDAHVAVTAGHGDSNTSGETVHLNPNVINGLATTVCTTDTALRALVTEAAQMWNSALSGLSYSAFTILASANCAGTDIEVRQRSSDARCQNEYDAVTGTGTRACYFADDNELPPRHEFSTQNFRRVATHLKDRALIVYQALSHEPGSN